MTRPTAYIETTVIGHLVGRILDDPIVAGRQTVTRQWWPTAIAKYRLFVSKVVADECAAGDPEAAKERLDVLDSLEFIATSPSVDARRPDERNDAREPSAQPVPSGTSTPPAP